MRIFFKKTILKTGIEYQNQCPRTLFYGLILLGVFSILILLILSGGNIKNINFQSIGIFQKVVIFILIFVVLFFGALSITSWLIGLKLVFKSNKEGGKITITNPNDLKASRYISMTKGFSATLMMPGTKIIWAKENMSLSPDPKSY